MPNELFGDLTYSPYVRQYQGLPVEEIKTLNADLEQKYNSNLENTTKLEIMAKNLKVLNQDAHHKDDALNNLNSTIYGIKENGNWEDAGRLVLKAGKDFATNTALNQAVSNKQARDQFVADELSRVNSEEGLPEAHARYSILQADRDYSGVQYDEELGTYRGLYNGKSAPSYSNISKEMFDLATKIKEEKQPLYVTDDKGNKKLAIRTENGYIYDGSEEYVGEDKIYKTIRGMILTNPKYQEQINYEINMNIDERFMNPDGTRREITPSDLKNSYSPELLGSYIKNTYGSSYTLDELQKDGKIEGIYRDILKNIKTDSYINPSQVGLSYNKTDIEKVKDWQMEWDWNYKKEKADAAVDQSSVLFAGYAPVIMNPTQLSAETDSEQGYALKTVIERNQTREQYNTLRANMQKVVDIINDPQTPESEKQKYKVQLDQLNAKLVNVQSRSQYLDQVLGKNYHQWLKEQGKISDDKLRELQGGKSYRQERIDELRKGALKNISFRDEMTVSGSSTFGQVINSSNIYDFVKSYFDDDKYKRANLNKDKFKEKFGQEALTALEELGQLYKESKKDAVAIENNLENYLEDIVEDEAQGYEPAYFDFSTNIKGDQSVVGKTLTNAYQNNKNAFTVWVDGKEVQLHDEDFEDQNPQNLQVIGITDYVPGQGYMLVGKVNLQEEGEKGDIDAAMDSDIFRTVLLRPKQGTGSVESNVNLIVQKALRNEYNMNNLKGKTPAQFGSGIELADAILSTHVENQSNIFRMTPVYEGEQTSSYYNLGSPKIKGDGVATLSSNVVRETTNGVTTYEVSVWEDVSGGSSQSTNRIGNNHIFQDLPSVERALERVMKQNEGLNSQSASTYDRPIGDTSNPKTGELLADSHNNPTAMTTAVAKEAGLVKDVDYIEGATWTGKDGRTYSTAYFIGDSIQSTVKAIDNAGFYTSTGQQRWTHTAMSDDEWNALTFEEKKAVVKEMYRKEGGTKLNNLF